MKRTYEPLLSDQLNARTQVIFGRYGFGAWRQRNWTATLVAWRAETPGATIE